MKSLMDVVKENIDTEYEDINSPYKSVYNYLKNIFNAFGVSLRDFNSISGNKKIIYKVNNNLADILKPRIEQRNFPSRNEIKKNIENRHSTEIAEYCEIINHFLECNFKDYNFYYCRSKLEKSMEELAKHCEEEARRYAAIANSIRENISLFINVDIFKPYALNDFFEKMYHRIFCTMESDNKSELSERSRAIMTLVSLNKLIKLETERLNILNNPRL